MRFEGVPVEHELHFLDFWKHHVDRMLGIASGTAPEIRPDAPPHLRYKVRTAPLEAKRDDLQQNVV